MPTVAAGFTTGGTSATASFLTAGESVTVGFETESVVDVAPPVLAVTSVADGATNVAAGVTTISGTATDDVEVTSAVTVQVRDTTANLYWNGTSWQTAGSYIAAVLALPAWSLPNVELFADRSYTVTVLAADDAGNLGVVSVSFTTIVATVGERPPPIIATDVYDPNNLSGAPPAAFYRYLFGDVMSGEVLGELPLIGTASNSHVLNGAGNIVAQVPLDGLPPSMTPETIAAGRTSLWVEVDGQLTKGGVLLTTEVDRVAGVLGLAAEGFLGYLRARLISSDLAFNADQLDIARALVALGGTSIGLDSTGGTPTSGVTRVRTYPWWDHKNIGEAIEQLAAVQDGFDFRFEYYWDGDKPKARFSPTYPDTGADAGVILEHGRGNCEVVATSVDASNVATTAFAVGASNGPKTRRAVGSSAVGLAGFPPREIANSYGTVIRQATLEEHVGRDLKRVEQPVERSVVRMVRKPGEPAGDRCVIGERVRVKADSAFMPVDDVMRIIRIDTVHDAGAETTAFDLAPLGVFL